MKKALLTVMSLSLLAGCGHKQEAVELTSGINLENLDTTANPLDDFYQYACGGWMKLHPLDDEHSRYGTFDKLGEDNQKQLRELVDSLAAAKNEQGSVAEKIAMFYNQGLDSVTLQKQGDAPLQPLMAEIHGLATREDLQKELVQLHLQGIYPFFGLFAEADADNAKMQMAWFYQGGTGMGDRDYYLTSDNAKLREGYLALMEKEFALSGYDKLAGLEAKKLAQMVMQVETRLAKAQYDRLKNRDPEATFHRTLVADADKKLKGMGVANYFKAMGLEKTTQFNLAQPEYFAEVNKVLATESIEAIKAYYAWNVINEAAAYLSDDFVEANFDFYGRQMSGTPSMKPRWKRVLGTVNSALSEAVGQMYVAKYFPPEAKERMITLVDNLKEAFGQRVDQADWMDSITKERAHEKLATIYVKVGYPDKWRDYSALEIKQDSYFANVLRSNRFDVAYMLSHIDRPTDIEEWLMPPQMVNAYYNPTTNEICFPAAILQPPFFNLKADDAVNYGGIGVVIGHEMTHGFDDKGRLYDKEGNLNDWWQPQDAENFTRNSQVLVEHFNRIKVLDEPETYANGTFCLGENIADNGGLHIAFLAMQNAIAKGQVNPDAMDNFTAAQRFFLSYAGLWASNIRNEEIVRLTLMDVHSLGKWRVNGTLPHVAEFLEAFGVKEGDGMYLPAENRVHLW